MELQEILSKMETATNQLTGICNNIPGERFFYQPPVKWSIAQNMVHLVTSASMTRIAYRLPKFMIRWYAGTPNRSSRPYADLVAKYQRKLSEGGKASGKFDTPKIDPQKGKLRIIDDFTTSMKLLHQTVSRKWKDEQLDKYLAPHPLLGKLTQRELLYFTIYHIHHHQKIIQERLAEQI